MLPKLTMYNTHPNLAASTRYFPTSDSFVEAHFRVWLSLVYLSGAQSVILYQCLLFNDNECTLWMFVQREDGMSMVRDAIAAGIFNDLGSGSNIDLCVITKDKVEYLRPYDEANKKGVR